MKLVFTTAVGSESGSFDVRMKVKHKAFELYQMSRNSIMLIYFVPSSVLVSPADPIYCLIIPKSTGGV